MARFNKPTRLPIEQDSDLTFLNPKRQIRGVPFDDHLLTNVSRYLHYSQNRKSFILRGDKFYRRHYNEVGEISHFQVFLPIYLIATLLKSLHGTASKQHRYSPDDARNTTQFFSFNCRLRAKVGKTM